MRCWRFFVGGGGLGGVYVFVAVLSRRWGWGLLGQMGVLMVWRWGVAYPRVAFRRVWGFCDGRLLVVEVRNISRRWGAGVAGWVGVLGVLLAG